MPNILIYNTNLAAVIDILITYTNILCTFSFTQNVIYQNDIPIDEFNKFLNIVLVTFYTFLLRRIMMLSCT